MQRVRQRFWILLPAGDFWHTRGTLPVEPLNAVVGQLAAWRQPTLMLPGNHDQVRRMAAVACGNVVLVYNTRKGAGRVARAGAKAGEAVGKGGVGQPVHACWQPLPPPAFLPGFRSVYLLAALLPPPNRRCPWGVGCMR